MISVAGEAGQRIGDRGVRVGVPDFTVGVHPEFGEAGAGELEALACLGDGRVGVGEVVAQARVQRRGDEQHGDRGVLGRALRDLLQQRRTRARPVGDDEDAMWCEHAARVARSRAKADVQATAVIECSGNILRCFDLLLEK